MKQSSRAWLLARHQSTAPAIDAARRAALAETLRSADNVPVPISQLLPALFLPNRRLWTALAATWLVLLTLHLSQRSASQPSATVSPQLAASPGAPRTESASRPQSLATSTSFAARQAQLHALLR